MHIHSRTCDGYEPSIEAPTNFSGVVSGSPSRPLPVGFLGSERERRLSFFFRQKTAPQLSGFFGGDFWESILLQAALHERSIRHAILALGSLHANFEHDRELNIQGYTNGWTYDFALKNYNQAINALIESFSQGQQVIDVPNVLYYVCMLRGEWFLYLYSSTHCQ
jgi:hypothetical protein